MPVETVGSDQALLQLIAIQWQALHKETKPTSIWDRILEYTNEGGRFSFYRLATYEKGKPTIEFLKDLADIVEAGMILSTKEGLMPTHLGICLAYGRRLPDSLIKLESAVEHRKIIITS